MRPFEILIPLLLAIYLLWPLITRKPYRLFVNSLPILAFVAVLLHLLIEKYRWQMVPLYALTTIILVISRLPVARRQPGVWSYFLAALGLIVTMLAASVPAILPIPRISELSGDYEVGTTSFMLVDESRRELYSGKDEPRRIMVQIWYPAIRGDSVRAPWMQDAKIVARAISDYFDFSDYFLDHLELARSPAYLDAAPEPGGGPYPAVVFSHGWNGFRAQNSYQMMELASHGYVTVAIDHTYGNVITVFPGGQVVYNNPSALPEGAPADEYTAAARLLGEQWSSDIAFVLDTLAANPPSGPARPVTDFVNFEQVGILGHSTGGGAAIQFCGTDLRCKAVFPMDAYMRPVSESVLENGLAQPALFMFSQEWADDVDSRNNQRFHAFYSQVTQPSPVITILGAAHYDFSDMPALSPLAHQLGLKGPINGRRVQQILVEYTIAFFDLYLKGKPTSLFEGPSAVYPELRWDN
ncbi:MAG: alpha/beta hydrolase family protein [Chloroflexota bacterium]